MTRIPGDSAEAAELRELDEGPPAAPADSVTRNETDDARPRCGRCDATRHVELPDGRLARCPRCHSRARLGRCPEPGCAFRWRDGTDRHCPIHEELT